jgi:hypothetical protein
MNGDRCPSQILRALGQHPTGSFVTASIFFVETTTYRDRGQGQQLPGGHHRCLLQLRWWLLSELPVAPHRGPPSMSSSTSVVDVVGAIGSTFQGPAIDVFFNIDGGCCRSYWQHLLGAPPSMSSSTSVVVAAGATDSTSRGPAINVFFNFGGGCC